MSIDRRTEVRIIWDGMSESMIMFSVVPVSITKNVEARRGVQ